MENRNMLFTIDKSSCTGCGICADVCPTGAIRMENGEHSFKAAYCISCGHCVAVCPRNSCHNSACPEEQMIDISSVPQLDPQTAEIFLRRRRSIRCFMQKSIERATLEKLLTVAHYAPTGSNSQSVGFLVMDDQRKLEQLIEEVIRWMEYQIDNKIEGYQYYKLFVRAYRSEGRDLIRRGAPCIVMAFAPTEQKRRADCATALAYLELFAPTLGLGSCWLGLLMRALDAGCRPVIDLLHIPEGQHIEGAVLLGHPKYKYRMLPERKPLKLFYC